jgi:hypothetical protein
MEVRLLKNKNVVTVSPIYSENSQNFFCLISNFSKIAATLLKELFIGLTTLPRDMVNNKTGGYVPG